MTIAQIRSTIETAICRINNIADANERKFYSINVPALLNKQIEAVQSLVIPARFVRDIENKKSTIECAQYLIQKWTALQA